MTLILTSKQNIDLSDFCKWFLPKVKEYILGTVNFNKLKKLNGLIWNDYKITNIEQWFLKTVKYIEWKQRQYQYIFQVNPDKKINNIKLENIAKLIEYGTLSFTGYPIYSECFNYLANNIQDYFSMYREGL